MCMSCAPMHIGPLQAHQISFGGDALTFVMVYMHKLMGGGLSNICHDTHAHFLVEGSTNIRHVKHTQTLAGGTTYHISRCLWGGGDRNNVRKTNRQTDKSLWKTTSKMKRCTFHFADFFWLLFFFARIIEMKAYLLINDQSIMMDTKLTGCKYISMNRKLLINCTGQQTN